MGSLIENIDLAVLYLFSHKNAALLSFFIDLYYLFYFILLFFVLYVYFVERNHKKFKKMAVLIMIGFIVVFALKFIVKKPRPESLIVKTDYSFPSSHAYFSTILFIFSGSGLIGLLFKILSVISLFSLIYIPVHYFSDAIFSAFIAFLFYFFYDFIEFFLEKLKTKKLKIRTTTIQKRKTKVRKLPIE